MGSKILWIEATIGEDNHVEIGRFIANIGDALSEHGLPPDGQMRVVIDTVSKRPVCQICIVDGALTPTRALDQVNDSLISARAMEN